MRSLRKTLFDIREFCKGKNKIYIYGAGKFGQSCKKILDYLNIKVEAFIVTEITAVSKTGCIDAVSGIPVIQRSSIELKHEDGIIIAVSNLYHYEIISHLKDMQYIFYETPMPSMVEITTKIGCSINCRYCPQEKLISKYSKKSNKFFLSMEDFTHILAHIPPLTFIRFCGMVEPFLNPNCADMIVYTRKHGYNVDCYSTLVGLNISDVDRVLDAVDDFVPHIPDKSGNAMIEISDEYIEKLEKVLEYRRNGERLVKVVSVHGEIDDRIRGLIPSDVGVTSCMQDRAGNLEGKDLEVVQYEFDFPVRCGFCENRLDSNIVLPNGDLLMCCMDYGMEYVFGNLLDNSYEKVTNSDKANKIRESLIFGKQKMICNYCMYAEELLG